MAKPKRLVQGKSSIVEEACAPRKILKTKAEAKHLLYWWNGNEWSFESAWPTLKAANAAFKKYAIGGELWVKVKIELPEVEYLS